MLRPYECFKIFRHVLDVNPYTHEPETEREIVGETFADPDKKLQELSAKYPNDNLWYEADQIWM